MDIKELRKKIDGMDDEMLRLLLKRADVSKEIGDSKNKDNKEIHDIARETEILERLCSHNKGLLSNEAVKYIFKEIFSSSASIQKTPKVAFLGPESTYSQLAAIRYFGQSYEYIPLKTISDVFLEVEKGNVEYGVVPIENSTEGMVNYTLDMMMESDIRIYSEIYIDIHHNLVSKEGDISKVIKIYSHQQPIAQCRKWIEDNLKNAELVEVASTGVGASLAANEKNSAAIASSIAAQNFGLNILAERIEDKVNNVTKFFVVSKNMPKRTKNSKTSVMFSIKDSIGALYDMLVPFKKFSINLTKIESRPTKKKAWEYVFFVDFYGHKDDENVEAALEMLEKKCLFLKVLGSYPVDKEERRKKKEEMEDK